MLFRRCLSAVYACHIILHDASVGGITLMPPLRLLLMLFFAFLRCHAMLLSMPLLLIFTIMPLMLDAAC